ncbi:helix-turn-helix domain-containing protein [Caulobacter soli]|uniref:helix-turn-helix domain-containing protein n=1 Tax=Caulobacter soli TaxID=2708539 RepID=UPI0013EABC1B|nr:helix-turn-helix domain-containing protein [Caulobacter soli]
MPLDTGRVSHLHLVADSDPEHAPMAAHQPSVDDGVDIGSALRAAREFRGLNLQDVADATRIRQSYIEALEDLRLDELPSRPFTIGYVKSYAKMLGLDGDAAVARFKLDVPDDSEPLRAPVGVRHERDPRLGLILAFGVLIVAAIVLWNVAQRAIAKDTPPAQVAPAQASAAVAAPAAVPVDPNAASGSVSLGAPLPAPVESTTPEPYKTPGLDDAAANGGSADAVSAASKARAVETAKSGVDPSLVLNVGAPFRAKGAVYGAAQAEASGLILQARKPASLTVHDAGGAIYFTRWMSTGEAFRAPRNGGLIAEVSDPSAFEVYNGGALTSRMSGPTASLGKLTVAPAAPAPVTTAPKPAAPQAPKPQG